MCGVFMMHASGPHGVFTLVAQEEERRHLEEQQEKERRRLEQQKLDAEKEARIASLARDLRLLRLAIALMQVWSPPLFS